MLNREAIEAINNIAETKTDIPSERVAFLLGMKEALLDESIYKLAALIKHEWISVNDRTPEMIDKKDYSKNVWATDGKNIYIMTYCYVANVGSLWANCYMRVDGEGEFDDDYDITHWQPLIIPKPPKQ